MFNSPSTIGPAPFFAAPVLVVLLLISMTVGVPQTVVGTASLATAEQTLSTGVLGGPSTGGSLKTVDAPALLAFVAPGHDTPQAAAPMQRAVSTIQRPRSGADAFVSGVEEVTQKAPDVIAMLESLEVVEAPVETPLPASLAVPVPEVSVPEVVPVPESLEVPVPEMVHEHEHEVMPVPEVASNEIMRVPETPALDMADQLQPPVLPSAAVQPSTAPAPILPQVADGIPVRIANQIPASAWQWLDAHGWRIDWRQGPGPGRMAEAQYATSTIVIWYESRYSDSTWVGAIGHELGHAVSFVHFSTHQMNEWNALRGLSSWRWVPGTPNDFSVGEGDFAEAFMCYLLGNSVRSDGGPLSDIDRAWIAANTPF